MLSLRQIKVPETKAPDPKALGIKPLEIKVPWRHPCSLIDYTLAAFAAGTGKRASHKDNTTVHSLRGLPPCGQ
ncbi:hypothetical protein GYB62_03135 [bacterium]|nr:hypothetical protein [bacterium]